MNIIKKKSLVIELVDTHIKYSNNVENTTQESFIIYENNVMNEIISKYKNLINDFNNNKIWEIFKKYVNEFELVYLPKYKNLSISQYIPISRSYFKLWEILYENNLLTDKTNIVTSHIAEGPGGFIDAIIRWRSKYSGDIYKSDKLYAITLKSIKREIPGWNKTLTFLKNNPNIHISYGSDETGDIYNIHNIDHFVKVVGKNTSDLCTADGGFDFSIDFNRQEELSYRIIVCEILIALSVQKNGGSFILKIFDIYSIFTIKLLYILSICYERVVITKPHLSRPANSEKYVVCSGFRGIDTELYSRLYTIVKNWTYNTVNNIDVNTVLDIVIPESFIDTIINYNIYITKKQIKCLLKAFEFIHNYKNDNTIINKQIIYQINVAKSWCRYYDVDIRRGTSGGTSGGTSCPPQPPPAQR